MEGKEGATGNRVQGKLKKATGLGCLFPTNCDHEIPAQFLHCFPRTVLRLQPLSCGSVARVRYRVVLNLRAVGRVF